MHLWYNIRIIITYFIKIVDIYGFIISYLPFFEALFDNYTELNDVELELFETFKKLFIKYLFSPRVQPINVNEVTNELKGLNKLLNVSSINNNNNKSTSLKVSSSRIKGVTGETYLLNFKHKKTSKIKTSKYSI